MFDGFEYTPFDWSLDAVDKLWIYVPIVGWLYILFRKAAGFIRHHLQMMTELFTLGLPDAPEAFSSICGEFTSHMTFISPLAEVMPWTQAGAAFAITITGLIFGFAIRIILMLVSTIRGAGL